MEKTAKIRNWTATASGDILDESGAVIFHRAPLSPERSFQEAKEDAQFVVMAGNMVPLLSEQLQRAIKITELYVEAVGIFAELVPEDCESPPRLEELMSEVVKIANECSEGVKNAKH